MKNRILRATALVFAAALSGAAACSGTGGGCGGMNSNASDLSSPTVPRLTCGAGTELVNNQCVANPSSTSASQTTSKVIGNQ